MPPAPEPVVEIASPWVSRRRIGLARLLGRLSVLAVVVPFAVGLLLLLVSALFPSPHLGIISDYAFSTAFFGVLGALCIAAVSFLLANWPALGSGSAVVTAGQDGLVLRSGRRRRRIPRSAVEHGFIIPATRPWVEIGLRGGDVVDVEVAGEEEGARLLAALGIGPEQRRAALSIGSPNRELSAGCFGVPLVAIGWGVFVMGFARALPGSIGFAIWLVLTAATGWFILRASRPTRVVVGTDGVRIERPFGSTWIPYTGLMAVTARGDRLYLHRHRAAEPEEVRAPALAALALSQRIRAAKALAASGVVRGAEALERHDRDPAAWRADLRKLITAGDYRAAGLTAEDLLAALDDAEAPRDRRVGAALALRIAGHPEAQARIRVAAETSADEELRAALEAAAEEEIDQRGALR